MSTLNKLILIGNLGRDPEIKVFGETVVAKFSVATVDYKKNTDWHEVTAFGKLADLAKSYLKKGSKVYLECTLGYRKYTDKEGNNRTANEIIVKEMTFLNSAKSSDVSTEEPPF